jgi:glutamyl-tRNA(Gln) amidotransferase subunit E
MFGGLLSKETWKGIRLGAELAGHAKAWAEVDGIIHTDELPGYGISGEEVAALRERVGAGDLDAVVVVVDEEERALEALRAVYARAREAVRGVPSETRAAKPDGTTVYMRPRPGAARMYPETDIPPYPITPDLISRIRENLPETLEETKRRLASTYGLSWQLVEKLVDVEREEFFEKVVTELGLPPTVVAATLSETLTNLGREGYPVENLSEEKLYEVFKALAASKFSKEVLPTVLGWLSQHPTATLEAGLKELRLVTASMDEVEAEVKALVDANIDKITDPRIVKKLMGDLMKKYRGKIDGSVLHEIVTRKVEEARSSTAPG